MKIIVNTNRLYLFYGTIQLIRVERVTGQGQIGYFKKETLHIALNYICHTFIFDIKYPDIFYVPSTKNIDFIIYITI